MKMGSDKVRVTQNSSDDLPELSGSKRIKGYAYKIRAAYQAINPGAVELSKEIDAGFWVKNKDRLLNKRKLNLSLPRLAGSSSRTAWAFTIRARLADVFPEAPLLHSQIDAEFWIANKRVFEYAVVGFSKAEGDKN